MKNRICRIQEREIELRILREGDEVRIWLFQEANGAAEWCKSDTDSKYI